jgi:hypothetical protein
LDLLRRGAANVEHRMTTGGARLAFIFVTKSTKLQGLEIRAWLGSETRIGVEPVLAHGGMDAQELRFEGDIGGRARGIDKGVRSHTGPGSAERTIAEPFSGR